MDRMSRRVLVSSLQGPEGWLKPRPCIYCRSPEFLRVSPSLLSIVSPVSVPSPPFCSSSRLPLAQTPSSTSTPRWTSAPLPVFSRLTPTPPPSAPSISPLSTLDTHTCSPHSGTTPNTDPWSTWFSLISSTATAIPICLCTWQPQPLPAIRVPQCVLARRYATLGAGATNQRFSPTTV